MNLCSRNWQWNCDPFQSKCKRFHEKIHARNDSFHYLEGCKSVCGTYGSIWPQPTGQSVIQHELKAFNIEDLAVKFDPKTTDQFLDEALTGKSYFITGKSLLEALIFASTNPQYDDRLFIELRVQYMKIPSSEHVENMLCAQVISFVFVLTFRTIDVHNMYVTCSELGISMY